MTERFRARSATPARRRAGRSASPPALVVVAHGSRDPRAAATVEALAARIRASRAQLDVAVAYLEHARPRLPETLARLHGYGHRAVVVVPLLLTAAYHSKIDLPRQLAAAGNGRPLRLAVRQAPVLGADPALLTVLERRIRQAGIAPGDRRWGLVVAAAGSADPGALAPITATAARLRRRGWSAVVAGFATMAGPSVPEAVALLRDRGVSRVAVASYLLAPGRFSDALGSSGADAVTAPLGDSPELARLLLRRYDATVRGRQRRPGRGGPRSPRSRHRSPDHPAGSPGLGLARFRGRGRTRITTTVVTS